MRPGAHDAHIALEDIKELRQFIDTVLAEKTSQPRNPGIVHNLERSAITLIHVHQSILAGIGVSHHRAELVAAEFPALAPHAPCFVKNWPRRINLYCDGSQQ